MIFHYKWWNHFIYYIYRLNWSFLRVIIYSNWTVARLFSRRLNCCFYYTCSRCQPPPSHWQYIQLISLMECKECILLSCKHPMPTVPYSTIKYLTCQSTTELCVVHFPALNRVLWLINAKRLFAWMHEPNLQSLSTNKLLIKCCIQPNPMEFSARASHTYIKQNRNQTKKYLLIHLSIFINDWTLPLIKGNRVAHQWSNLLFSPSSRVHTQWHLP